MADSFAETRRELDELMQRLHRSRIAPPTPEGITPSEARTMMSISMLEADGGAIRPGRVAQIAHTTPSALSQTFKTLEEKGLIERRRTSDDYRAITVSLTDEGRAFAEDVKRLRDRHIEQVMAYVGEQDAAHLVRILRKVVDFHRPADASAPVSDAPDDRCGLGCGCPFGDDGGEEGDAPCA